MCNPKQLYSKNNRVRVLLDMDDVITACLRSVVKEFNEKHGTNFNPANCEAWDLTKTFGCSLESLMEIFRTPGFFENLEPKRGAIGAIRELIKSTKYDLFIITATSDEDGSEYVEKLNWLEKYLPEFNKKRLIACSEKSIIRGDVIIDDKVENLDECAPFMQCVLMDSPTNQDCDKYIRIKRLKELPELLDTMFYNDNGGVKAYEKEIKPAMIEEQNKVHYSKKIKSVKRKKVVKN